MLLVRVRVRAPPPARTAPAGPALLAFPRDHSLWAGGRSFVFLKVLPLYRLVVVSPPVPDEMGAGGWVDVSQGKLICDTGVE